MSRDKTGPDGLVLGSLGPSTRPPTIEVERHKGQGAAWFYRVRDNPRINELRRPFLFEVKTGEALVVARLLASLGATVIDRKTGARIV